MPRSLKVIVGMLIVMFLAVAFHLARIGVDEFIREPLFGGERARLIEEPSCSGWSGKRICEAQVALLDPPAGKQVLAQFGEEYGLKNHDTVLLYTESKKSPDGTRTVTYKAHVILTDK